MKKYSIEIKWAVIYSIMTIAWALIGKAMGFQDEKIEWVFLFNTLILIPSLIIYFLVAIDKRKNFYAGGMTFGQGFTSGMIMTILIAVLSLFTTWVSLQLISPDFFKHAIAYFTANKTMSEEKALQQFSLGSFIVQGLMGAVVTGLIFSLITSAIVRKRPAV